MLPGAALGQRHGLDQNSDQRSGHDQAIYRASDDLGDHGHGFNNEQNPFDYRDYYRSSRPIITIYSEPDFAGRSVTLTEADSNLDDLRFEDRARSVRVSGTWIACEGREYRGRCIWLSGEVPDLAEFDLDRKLSSLRPHFASFDDSGVPGFGSVFFARPTLDGAELPSDGRRSVERFCASMQLGRPLSFSESRRPKRLLLPDGQAAQRRTLRDVLCRML